MPGKIDFRHHLDESLRRVIDDVADIGGGVMAFMGFSGGPFPADETGTPDGVGPPGACLHQFRPGGDFQPPTLVVGEVEMQDAHTVEGHHIQEAPDGFHGLEVTAAVQQIAPPAEAGSILDNAGREGLLTGRRGQKEQLGQNRRSPEQSRRCRGIDADALWGNGQPVGFRSDVTRGGIIGGEAEVYRCRRGGSSGAPEGQRIVENAAGRRGRTVAFHPHLPGKGPEAPERLQMLRPGKELRREKRRATA